MPDAPRKEPADETATLRVIVVDDEPVARATLRNLLAVEEGAELVAECANGSEALAAVRRERPDVLFLDVQMPGMNGLQVLEELRPDERPAVVFTTAFDQYALRAFEEEAVDYLLKPFDDDRFRSAFARVRERLRTDSLARMGRRVAEIVSGHASGAARAEGEGEEREPVSRLSVHREGRIELVDVDALDWVEAADQYVRLHTAGGECLMRQSMGELERILDPARFARVHRSAIVALDRIVRLESRSGGTGEVLLRDGARVPVARSRISALRRMLG